MYCISQNQNLYLFAHEYLQWFQHQEHGNDGGDQLKWPVGKWESQKSKQCIKNICNISMIFRIPILDLKILRSPNILPHKNDPDWCIIFHGVGFTWNHNLGWWHVRPMILLYRILTILSHSINFDQCRTVHIASKLTSNKVITIIVIMSHYGEIKIVQPHWSSNGFWGTWHFSLS